MYVYGYTIYVLLNMICVFFLLFSIFMGPEVIAITYGCRCFRSLCLLLQFLCLHQNLKNNIGLTHDIVIVNV